VNITKTETVSPILRLTAGLIPEIGIILGSGLGALADKVQAVAKIPFAELPDFPRGQIAGHAGRLVLGTLAGKRVAVMAGRFHFYQGFSMREVTAPVRLLANLGVETLLVTNAAGGISRKFRTGDLMLIDDHINFIGVNPLAGEMRDGHPIFLDMTEAYSASLKNTMRAAARREKIALKRGVYLAASGPSYETPAEIRAFAKLGADAVGMSTAPEVIAARSLGLEVCGLSCITNLAAGRTRKPLSHEEVLETTHSARDKIVRLVGKFAELL